MEVGLNQDTPLQEYNEQIIFTLVTIWHHYF